jgi:hypothetical protein
VDMISVQFTVDDDCFGDEKGRLVNRNIYLVESVTHHFNTSLFGN